jgi:hypothetical protein
VNELSAPVTVPASPLRSHLNPCAPVGAKNFRPRDVAYVVEAPNSQSHGHSAKLWVITCDTWLPGWEVNRRVRLVSATHAVEVTVKGIMDFATVTPEGSVPNLRLPHWRAVNLNAR